MDTEYTPHVRTDQELRQLALDIRAGAVFGTWNFPSSEEAQRMTGTVFMPLLFMDDEARGALEEAAHIFEYVSNAGPRGVNGYPCFFSFQILRPDETARLDEMLKQLDTFVAG